MRATAILFLLFALQGCALGRNLANVPLGWMGAGIVPKPTRPEWNGVAAKDLPQEQVDYWRARGNQDHADCYAQGAALSTWSAGGAWNAGTGVASGGSRFNEGVYLSCMQAKGWAYDGYTLAY